MFMRKFKIVDLNRHLIQELKKLGIDAVWGDIFSEAEQDKHAVLMTASNPKYTMGGGVDAVFKEKFPEIIAEKQEKGGGMERIGNICFCQTVDENYQATPEIVEKAIKFALSTLKKNETLYMVGCGVGIGGMSIEEFCRIVLSLSLSN